MAVITSAAGTFTYNDTFKHEYEVGIAFCHENAVANEVAITPYRPGTVVGKVTATGKIKRQDASAADGSQVAYGVVSEDKTFDVAAATDTKVRVMVRGPAIVNKSMLVMGAGTDTDAEKLVVYAALEAKNILVNTGITL
jgi:hypothetical protein